MNNSLTPFGYKLAQAVRSQSKTFDSSFESHQVAYRKNIVRINLLHKALNKNPRVLVAGAGKVYDVVDLRSTTKTLLRLGVNWTNFNPELDLQVLGATHAIALEAALFGEIPPELMIHGVYSKVPPCISNSFTIRWSDPFMTTEFGTKPTAQNLDEIITNTAIGPLPYIRAVRNVVFFNAMIMIWLGAKEIYFTGVDPLRPEYFFAGDQTLTLDIIKAVSQTNPWIADWDGRNERISGKLRDSEHRKSTVIQNLLAPAGSGVSNRIDVMVQGYKLLLELCSLKEVKVGYIGESQFLKQLGLDRIS